MHAWRVCMRVMHDVVCAVRQAAVVAAYDVEMYTAVARSGHSLAPVAFPASSLVCINFCCPAFRSRQPRVNIHSYMLVWLHLFVR